MTAFYWLTRLCEIHTWSLFATLISLFVSAILVIAAYFDSDYIRNETINKMYSYAKRGFYIAIFSLVVAIFTPSKSDIAIIIGGGSVYEYINNSDEAKQLPDNVIHALNKWLKEGEK